MADTAATFAVVPDHVRDAGRYLQETAAALTAGMRSATADVDSLLSTWRGLAATAYGGAWDSVAAEAFVIFDALADMAETMGVVVDRAQAVDYSRAGTFGSLDLP
ncbi:WXG100 family type VII secretion target [Nocardia bovistercoris]|uniref:WXG100 family type VII secretion target n=1 Tax=Nocardia bovistercoris TaxID=2785916 RepID=A0A931IF62_9NOCA|nr:WXG100 family type VII secretion target [Nocardia bovistercoris]MBH0778578.1 WXG100 family type VII secretion target [Nocardia bovistercoris]